MSHTTLATPSGTLSRAIALVEADFIEWRHSATPGHIDLLSQTISRSGLPVDRWETVRLVDVRNWLGR